MNSDIIRGITEVDPSLHVAISDYKATIPAGEEGVHVIEIANGPAKHLGNRILCFGRWITHEDLEGRMELYKANPEQYFEEHLQKIS